MGLHAITVPKRRLFRSTALAFALVLACMSAWFLTAEISRSNSIGFRENPLTAAPDQDVLDRIASLGMIRGDLWADVALTNLNWLVNDGHSRENAQASGAIDRARNVATRALGFSPHDSRIWLVLAGVELRFDWLNRKAAAALRMSYYTGANEIDLIPLRLLLAVRSEALGDNDFQQLVRHDIRIVVTRRPELKSAIVTAYREAPPGGRQFIEDALVEIDPSLLRQIRSKG